MSQEKYDRMIGILSLVFIDPPMNEDTIQVYALALRDLDSDHLNRAIVWWIGHQDKRPLPSQLRQIATDISKANTATA